MLVRIIGRRGEGKSLLAAVILRALKNMGIEAKILGHEDQELAHLELLVVAELNPHPDLFAPTDFLPQPVRATLRRTEILIETIPTTKS